MRAGGAVLLASVAAMAACSDDASVGAGDPDAGGPAQRADAGSFELPAGAPELLSETGLYADIASGTLAPEARGYEPAFELWSDGASKRRWLLLPAGTQIDTSDIDFWKYPPDTKVFKEFTRDGVVVETRMIRKRSERPGDWALVAYQWNAEGTDAVAVPNGVTDASRTGHDIPNVEDCATCHRGVEDVVLGVTALQLSHDREGLTLQKLIDEGLLTDPPDGPLELPGDAVARAALGYLHANCGNCHNSRAGLGRRSSARLWVRLDMLGAVEDTGAWASAVKNFEDDCTVSDLTKRMALRRGVGFMPPIGSELVDEAGIDLVDAWLVDVAAVACTADPDADAGP